MSTSKSIVNAAPISPLHSRCTAAEFTRKIISEILTSDEWETFVLNDPQIRKAEKEFYKELFKLSPQTRLDFEDAHAGVVNAYMDAAALFGMHFIENLRAAAADPFALFQGVTDSAEA